ncbi:MAG: right-handed parallel beta-helix repeat-containing protein [Mogibacterium sp.]|nr:right-handed parallel beta-helix repeat-containing protein [Mogibacterium sp.]
MTGKKRLYRAVLIATMIWSMTAVFAAATEVFAVEIDPCTALELQDQLSRPKTGVETVKLGAGTWNIDRQVKIPAGIILDLNGQTLNGTTGSFVLDGDSASIQNGTLQFGGGIIVAAADSNGFIKGVTINGAGIQVKANAAIGEISGNTILNATEGIRVLDKGKTGNIEKNIIKGTSSHAIVARDSGRIGDISGNTLTDCKGHGISLYRGTQVGKITQNYLENIGGANDYDTGDYAITINASGEEETFAAEITHNTIINARYASIVVYSEKKGSNSAASRHKGYIIGDIAYNTITGSGTIKKDVDWIKGDKLECQGAIYVASYADVRGDIHDNMIKSSYDDGIDIRGGGTVNNIYNNKINSTSNAGIAVKDKSNVKGNIYNNTVDSSKVYGIFVNTNSEVAGSVHNNEITDPGQNGVFVTNSATMNVLKENTITGAGLYGVIAGAKGRINEISANVISTKNAKKGMGILSNTGCYIKTINANRISGKYNSGIRIKSPTGKVKVTKNTIKCSNPKKIWSTGISVEGCKKKTITITANKIKGNKNGTGIRVSTSAAKIKKNKISKCKNAKSITKGKYKVVQ